MNNSNDLHVNGEEYYVTVSSGAKNEHIKNDLHDVDHDYSPELLQSPTLVPSEQQASQSVKGLASKIYGHRCEISGCDAEPFMYERHLIRHMRSKHYPTTTFMCPFCPYQHRRRIVFKAHFKRAHPDKSEDDPLIKDARFQSTNIGYGGRYGAATLRPDEPLPKLENSTNPSTLNIVLNGIDSRSHALQLGHTSSDSVYEADDIGDKEWQEPDVSYSVYPTTDSAYASMGITRDECKCAEDEDDSKTVYTDNQELDIPENTKEKLASALSSELVRDLQEVSKIWNNREISRTTMQELLKEFSIRLRAKASPGQQKDASTFVRHYRNRIAKLIETSMKVAFGEPHQRNEEIAEDTPLKKSDGLSVIEKMCFWDYQVPEATELEGTILNSYEDDESEDFAITNFPVAWRFIRNSHTYQWLLGKLKTEMLLNQKDNTPSERIRVDILDVLTSMRTRKKYDQDVSKAKFEITWNLPAFLRDHYPNENDIKLGSIITLIGSGINVQALTCNEYMNQTWPTTGTETLLALQIAISNRAQSPDPYITEDTTRITLKIDEAVVFATVTGTESAIAEIGQQLAWLGAALRPSLLDDQMVTKFEDSFEDEPNGFCWRHLFRNPVVVKGFPILARFNDEKGLEITLNIMTGLGEASQVTNFLGGMLIKGFSTLFYPTKRTNNSISWHYAFNINGSRISYLAAGDAGTERAPLQDVSTACLEGSRNFLGWASLVEIHAGSKDIDYRNINWAGANLASSGIALGKISVGAGYVITGGASFIKGKQDTPIYLRKDGPYEVQIHSAYNMKVVLYDTKDRTGWLLDGACALLHITRTQLASSPYSESEKFRMNEFHHPDPGAGAIAAKQALMDLRNRKLVIFEKTERSTESRKVPDGVAEEQEKEVIKKWTYEDLVLQTFHILEQIHDYQTKMMSSSEIAVRLSGRDKLLGFGFMDIVDGQNDLFPRVATLKSSGRAWIDFTKSIRAIPLLGKGFGEIIRPHKNSNKLCKRWKHVPLGKDYLVACTKTLEEICSRYGDCDSSPLEIAGGIYWHKAHLLFEDCERSGLCDGTCDRVQVLLPKFSRLKKQAQPFDCQGGAVIFGKSKRFQWSFPSSGDPIEGEASGSEQDLNDSGIGESIPSTSEIDSSRNLDSPLSGSAPESGDFQVSGGILVDEEPAESVLELRNQLSVIVDHEEQSEMALRSNLSSGGILHSVMPPTSSIEPKVFSHDKYSRRRSKRAFDKVMEMTQIFPIKKQKGDPSTEPVHDTE